MIRIQADYGDVVPRRDFVMLEAKHNELVETYEKRNAEYEQVHEELTVLLDEHKHVSNTVITILSIFYKITKLRRVRSVN